MKPELPKARLGDGRLTKYFVGRYAPNEPYRARRTDNYWVPQHDAFVEGETYGFYTTLEQAREIAKELNKKNKQHGRLEAGDGEKANP